MPTPSRTAAYSASASPKDSLQSQPPSSMNVAPRACTDAVERGLDRLAHDVPPRRWAAGAGSLLAPALRGRPRRYTPSLNRCSTRRGVSDAARTRSPTVGSGPGEQPCREDQECLRRDERVVQRIVWIGHRHPQTSGGPGQSVPELASAPTPARRRPRSPGSGRRSCAVATTPGSARRSPTGSAPRRRRTRPGGSCPRSRPAAHASPAPGGGEPARSCGRSSWIFCDVTDGGTVRVDQLMDRVAEDHPAGPDGHDAEGHDGVAGEVEARRLEVQRCELGVAPRLPPDAARRARRPSREPRDTHDPGRRSRRRPGRDRNARSAGPVHELNVEPRHRPGGRRGASAGRTGRRTRRRSRPAGPTGRTRPPASRRRRSSSGSTRSPVAGSIAPNVVSVTASPGR